MKRILILAAVSLSTAPAFAGNLEPAVPDATIAPAPAPVIDTGRDWTGFRAGAQLGYADVETDISGVDGDGVLGGIHGGYDHDFGRYVLGVGLDYDFGDIELGDNDANLDNVARLKFRGGYDLGQTLVYATAGYAYAEGDEGGSSADGDGYFAGVGADYMVTDTISVGGEILYHDIQDFGATDIEATTLSAKVAFHF